MGAVPGVRPQWLSAYGLESREDVTAVAGIGEVDRVGEVGSCSHGSRHLTPLNPAHLKKLPGWLRSRGF